MCVSFALIYCDTDLQKSDLTRLPDVWRSINDLTWRIDYQTFLKLFFDVVHK